MGTLLDGPRVDEAVPGFQGHRSEVRVGQPGENPVRENKITFTLSAPQGGAALPDSLQIQRRGAAHAEPPERRTHSGAQ